MATLRVLSTVLALLGMWVTAAGPVLALPLEVSGDPGKVDTTQDTPDVQIDQFHMIVTPEDDRVRVSEVYLLGNPGEDVFDGEDGITVVFPLPEGVQALTYEGAETGSGPYQQVPGGLADTRPISPGVAAVEARFSYELPFAPGLRIAHAMPLSMQSGVLLVSGASWKLAGQEVEAGTFTDLGVMDFGGDLARTYLIVALDPGDMLAFEIVPETTPLSELLAPGQAASAPMTGSTPVAGTNRTLETGLVLVSVVAAMALTYMLWRGPSSGVRAQASFQPGGDGGPGASGALPEAALADLRAIAELDQQAAAGEVDASTYRRLRQGLKARVRAAFDDRDPGTD